MNTRKVAIRYGFQDCREELEQRKPAAVELLFPADEPSFLEILPEVEGLFGHITREEFPRARKLAWVQNNATGCESFEFPEMRGSQVAVTGINGLLAEPVAEHGLGLLLSLTRGLHRLRDQQNRKVWKVISGRELCDLRALVIGTGNIGRTLAGKLGALGVTMRGVDIAPRPVEGFAAVQGMDALDAELPEADVVFVCCPRTPDTLGLLDAGRIARMKPGSLLIAVSRGGIIVENALQAALADGPLAGAALDVFASEPLPPDSPLWEIPQLLITPHSAGYSNHTSPRKKERFLANLHAWANGEPYIDLLPLTRVTNDDRTR